MSEEQNKTALAGLLAVQRDLKAPKNQFNKFGGYNYRSCEDILQAARPLCNENGLDLLLSDEPAMVGARFYIKATATVMDIATGETISTTAYAREADAKKGMDPAQVTGASSSYARKYALCGLFAIDDTKDMDTDEHARQTGAQEARTASQPNDHQEIVNKLATEAKKKGIQPATMSAIIKKHYGKAGSKDMSVQELWDLINNLPQYLQEG